jgi:hypothetical protein
MKQTAVDWLIERLNKLGFAQVVTDEEIKQAKEIEKEQSIDFARLCLNKAKDLDVLTAFINAQKYYNETYNDNK